MAFALCYDFVKSLYIGKGRVERIGSVGRKESRPINHLPILELSIEHINALGTNMLDLPSACANISCRLGRAL